jgi:16S rRNA G527 N7-methylase RsmG
MHIPPERQRFIDIFIAKNAQLNLSAIRSPEDIFLKHIYDSLELQRLENSIGESFLHP